MMNKSLTDSCIYYTQLHIASLNVRIRAAGVDPIAFREALDLYYEEKAKAENVLNQLKKIRKHARAHRKNNCRVRVGFRY